MNFVKENFQVQTKHEYIFKRTRLQGSARKALLTHKPITTLFVTPDTSAYGLEW